MSRVYEKDWKGVQAALLEYQQSDIHAIQKALGPYIRPLPKESQIPFVWRVYHNRPQICYNLASQILHDIYLGEFREVQYLPSYEKLAEKYGVSVSTLRRTIAMLSQAGACRTINGKGTRIFTLGVPCDPPDFNSPAVRRNLAFFVQSFEILIYSCDGVTRSFLTALSPDRKAALTGCLEECLITRRGELSFWCYLIHVSQYSHLAGIREIYRTVYHLFLWGYPLKASSGALPELERATQHFAESLVMHLKEDDIEQCAADVKVFLTRQFPAAKRYLIRHGIQPEELRLSPAIRLFLTDGDGPESRTADKELPSDS